MSKNRISGWMLVAALLLTAPLHAGLSETVVDPGNSGYPVAWLNYPGTAKAVGFGGAYISVAEDLGGIYYNPGTLVKAAPGLLFSGAMLPESRWLGSITTGWQSRISGDRISAKTVSVSYVTATGLDGYDASGTAAAAPSVYGLSGSFAMSWSLAANPAAGGYGFAVQGIYDSVDGEAGFGAALHAGADFSLMNILRLAVAVRNIGLMQYQDTLWLKPLVAGSLIVNIPGVPLALIVQVDKTLWTDELPVTRFATKFTVFKKKLSSDEQAYRQAYQDILKGNLDKPVKKDGKSSALDSGMELNVSAGLAHGRLYGGIDFQVRKFEFCYALGWQPESSEPGHFFSINYNF